MTWTVGQEVSISGWRKCGRDCPHFVTLFDPGSGGCDVLDQQHPGSEFAIVLVGDQCVAALRSVDAAEGGA